MSLQLVFMTIKDMTWEDLAACIYWAVSMSKTEEFGVYAPYVDEWNPPDPLFVTSLKELIYEAQWRLATGTNP